jgi:drug/metabolite transporter (DMT)-like permease
VPWLSIAWEGALYAAISGAVTSGMGYAVWYVALRYLSATRAALVQLSVPVLAASGGAAFLSESVTLRLVVASVVILGSISLGLVGQPRRR